jgi:hypothetical protein
MHKITGPIELGLYLKSPSAGRVHYCDHNVLLSPRIRRGQD